MVVDMSIRNQESAPKAIPRVYQAVPRDRRVERLQEELAEYRRDLNDSNGRLTEAKLALETANLEIARLSAELDAAYAELAKAKSERKSKNKPKTEVRAEPQAEPPSDAQS